MSKVYKEKKETMARMELLGRKGNQDWKGLLDLQEQLGVRVLKEKREIKETVAYLGREVLKVTEGKPGLRAFRVQWEFQDYMANMAPLDPPALEGIQDTPDLQESQECQGLKGRKGYEGCPGQKGTEGTLASEVSGAFVD